MHLSTLTYSASQSATSSNNTDLSGLTISSGTLTPAFVNTTISYTDTIINSVSSVTVTPTTVDPRATIRVNGVTVISGNASGSITTNVGDTSITIVVTARDGVTTKTYSIAVHRVSNVATLSALTVDSGTLTPSFASGTVSYTDTVLTTVSTLSVTATVTESHATITGNGSSMTSGSPTVFNLSYGLNSISIVVTAEDGTTNTYSLGVTRQVSSDATLSALTVQNSNGGTVALTFNSATISYSLALQSYTVSYLVINPTTTNEYATMTINGNSVTQGGPYYYYLSTGSNSIPIYVVAQSGQVAKTYTLNINLEASPGQSEYTTPGTYSWTAPTGVYSVSVVIVSGGGGGGYIPSKQNMKSSGGGGGALAYIQQHSVTPGTNYTVVVGAGGARGSAGGDSYFRTTSILQAVGGSAGGTSTNSSASLSGGPGGTRSGTALSGGGNGGYGGASIMTGLNGCGGGGGAGGYSNTGGQGGAGSGASGATGLGGSGGGGGGTNASNLSYFNASAAAGGVSIYGAGSNGTGGYGSVTSGYYDSGGGGGGSSGTSGDGGGSTYGFPSSISSAPNPGLYGAGGASGYYAGGGGGGAARIIWPASVRYYPSTRTADE